jgi:hypothetical protein
MQAELFVDFLDAGAQRGAGRRQDAGGEELQRLVEGGERIVIAREFISTRRPVKWTVWTVGVDGVWLKTIMGAVDACA